MKPLIIGEAPSRTGDPKKVIDGALGAKLAAFCGMNMQTFRAEFARANVTDAWPGQAGKGSMFDAEPSARLRRRLLKGRLVIMLGKRVARAFDMDPDYFIEQRTISGAGVYVVPHPSGINRFYNSAENRSRMACFMRSLA